MNLKIYPPSYDPVYSVVSLVPIFFDISLVNLMFMWPCILNIKWRVRPTRCNKLWFINNPLAQHVSGIIMPILRSAGHTLLHMVFSTACAGWSLGKPASRLKTICSNIWPALLIMGIMMPETCWANGLLINHNLLHLVGLTHHFISLVIHV